MPDPGSALPGESDQSDQSDTAAQAAPAAEPGSAWPPAQAPQSAGGPYGGYPSGQPPAQSAGGPYGGYPWGQPPPQSAGAPYGGYPWGQPPPPTRPGRARLHVTWLIVTLAVAAVVGTSAYEVGRNIRPAAVQQPTVAGGAGTGSKLGPATCAPSVTSASKDSQLIADLLPLPPGATRPASNPRPKVYSLGGYVGALYSGNSQEKAVLAARCFQTAVNGQWQTTSGTLVSTWLVQFAGTSGAESYALGQQTTDVGLMGAHGRAVRISGVPAGRLIEKAGLDKYGNTTARLFGYGGRVMILMYVFTPAQFPSRASLAALLRDQAARL
jgi:hypothetical protein